MHLRTILFRTWFRFSRPITLGVRAIVEDDTGKVLLVRHTYVEDLYLPGGGVEHGEPAEESLKRELIEEAGIALLETPELLGIFSSHRIFKNDHVLLYKSKSWRPVEATSQGEIAECVWCDPQNMPEDVSAGTRRRLKATYGANGRCDAYW